MEYRITSTDEIENIGKNKIILEDPESFSMNNSEIIFAGSNNILYIEKNVRLERSKIKFEAQGGVIYLSRSSHDYKINVRVYNNCTCFIGENGYFNAPVHIICSEGKHVFIGREALISHNVWIRTADPHLVFSEETGERINPSKSVYIGDHVWIGQDVVILKGTQIHSGSILGGGAVIAGKKIPSNTSYAGNPAKEIARGIFWEETVVHRWTEEDTEKNKTYQGERSFIFDKTDTTISFSRIENQLAERDSAKKKLKYLRKIAENEDMNRFAWRKPAPPNTLKYRIRMALKRWILKIIR